MDIEPENIWEASFHVTRILTSDAGDSMAPVEYGRSSPGRKGDEVREGKVHGTTGFNIRTLQVHYNNAPLFHTSPGTAGLSTQKQFRTFKIICFS